MRGASVVVDLMGAVDADVLKNANGFQGTLQRVVQSKILLDNEWGTDNTVYMDDYPRMLSVAQMGERLTNAPSNAMSLLGKWPALTRAACEEIGALSTLRPALKTQVVAQLCTDNTAAPAEKEQRGAVVD